MVRQDERSTSAVVLQSATHLKDIALPLHTNVQGLALPLEPLVVGVVMVEGHLADTPLAPLHPHLAEGRDEQAREPENLATLALNARDRIHGRNIQVPMVVDGALSTATIK